MIVAKLYGGPGNAREFRMESATPYIDIPVPPERIDSAYPYAPSMNVARYVRWSSWRESVQFVPYVIEPR
jgi:hypothetical protein